MRQLGYLQNTAYWCGLLVLRIYKARCNASLALIDAEGGCLARWLAGPGVSAVSAQSGTCSGTHGRCARAVTDAKHGSVIYACSGC